MANSEHEAIFQKGVYAWNQWRESHPDVIPDLCWANMDGQDLFGVEILNYGQGIVGHGDAYPEITPFDLSQADLSNASLVGARLESALLSNAILVGANLSEANLSGSNLRGADLRSVNLSAARLRHVNLTSANLQGADFRRAVIDWITLTGANLKGADFRGSNIKVQELTSASTVTGLKLSPKAWGGRFLRRFLENQFKSRTLPDGWEEIEWDEVIVASRSPAPVSCFVSYSSEDEDFATRLVNDLRSHEIRCWFAPHDLPIGGSIRDEIEGAIRHRDRLLLILSSRSVESQWVQNEVETAFEEERRRNVLVLFPIRLDDSVLDTKRSWAATVRRQRNIGDFRGWRSEEAYRESFERLLRDLKSTTKKPMPSAVAEAPTGGLPNQANPADGEDAAR